MNQQAELQVESLKNETESFNVGEVPSDEWERLITQKHGEVRMERLSTVYLLRGSCQTQPNIHPQCLECRGPTLQRGVQEQG